MMFKYEPFVKLGNYLSINTPPQQLLDGAKLDNHCFTESNVYMAINAISRNMLNETLLLDWLSPYINHGKKYNSCAIIMAGNIPLVGFLDMMVCSICDIKTYVKYSSKDRVLMEWVVSILRDFGCNNIFEYSDKIVVESVIATGSNNANRYFKHQFGNIPSIIRGSRSSIAILSGKESREDILNLWHDIFDYFGLGCRSVSHILVPKGYDISLLCKILSEQKIENESYINSYRQNKALKIMNSEPFFDGGYFIATVSDSLTPNIGEITFSYSNNNSNMILDSNKNHIQCIVGEGYIPFGISQQPSLGEWADDINLFNFLLK